jgi:hypothetical protein
VAVRYNFSKRIVLMVFRKDCSNGLSEEGYQKVLFGEDWMDKFRWRIIPMETSEKSQ